MANSANCSVNLSYSGNAGSLQRNSGNVAVTVTGNPYSAGIQSIPTSDTQLPLNGITTVGLVLLHNLDATNYVTVGVDGTNFPVQINAGESQLFRLSGSAVHVKANAAACLLEFTILPN